jgi:hypothetical protein
MDVLCVSTGKNIIHLHEDLGSTRACVCSEVMATVLERCTNEEQRSVVRFLLFCGFKKSVERILIKKGFLFMVRSALSRKAVHNWV